MSTANPLPLLDLDDRTIALLRRFHRPPAPLYRVLAHQPALLEAWLAFATALSNQAETPRSLRELMILRSAQVMNASYQWRDHSEIAQASGLDDASVEALAEWPTSDQFDGSQRAVLALVDGMLAGHLADSTIRGIAERFPPGEAIELILTAGFYSMVPRVLDALRLSSDVCVPQPHATTDKKGA
jgi:alkylhydroperoxidase family enzyme